MYKGALQRTFNPIKMVIGGLEPGLTYNYELLLNEKAVKPAYPLTFRTRQLWEHRQPAPDFSFVIGSCAYINEPIYDRPGDPYGKSTAIFRTLAAHPTNFMLWLGDNNYLREVDYSSGYGIRHRYSHDRKVADMQPLLAAYPHYAIWDDHDYGPNDSNASYELRNSTLKVFSEYWGNKSFGLNGAAGAYGRFSWSDADFFLLDNRYHRSPERWKNDDSTKSYLGRRPIALAQKIAAHLAGRV